MARSKVNFTYQTIDNVPYNAVTYVQALHRVRMAVQLDSHTNVEPYLIHSTSAIDTTSCFYQVLDRAN